MGAGAGERAIATGCGAAAIDPAIPPLPTDEQLANALHDTVIHNKLKRLMKHSFLFKSRVATHSELTTSQAVIIMLKFRGHVEHVASPSRVNPPARHQSY